MHIEIFTKKETLVSVFSHTLKTKQQTGQKVISNIDNNEIIISVLPYVFLYVCTENMQVLIH